MSDMPGAAFELGCCFPRERSLLATAPWRLCFAEICLSSVLCAVCCLFVLLSARAAVFGVVPPLPVRPPPPLALLNSTVPLAISAGRDPRCVVATTSPISLRHFSISQLYCFLSFVFLVELFSFILFFLNFSFFPTIF